MLTSTNDNTFDKKRFELVNYLKTKVGITNDSVLKAFGDVHRHRFVPNTFLKRAYDDDALPIGSGQTISKPSVMAIMLEAAEIDKTRTVLEIGTGSGYLCALMASLGKYVYSLERIDALAKSASKRLGQLGYMNVSIKTFDGTYGWPDRAPFDAIIISAASPGIPERLVKQLARSGVMICPIGNEKKQVLGKIKNSRGSIITEEITSCKFVPLVGKYGW
jgi:protein-L-isoaspartate(D-aspartate) O-methyltransferase